MRLTRDARAPLRYTLLLYQPPHALVPILFLVLREGTAYFGPLDPLLNMVLSRSLNLPTVFVASHLLILVPLVQPVVLDFPVDHLVDVFLDPAEVRLGSGMSAGRPRYWAPLVKGVIDVI